MNQAFLSGLLLIVANVALAQPPAPKSEKALLDSLKKLTQPLELSEFKDMTAEEIRASIKKRAGAILGLVSQLEKTYPQSAHLNEARSQALTVFAHIHNDELFASAQELAEGLLKSAPKGSDFAAQAELFLLSVQFNKTFQGFKSLEELRAAWTKHADTVRAKIKAYIDVYPQYRPAADALVTVRHFAELVDDAKTSQMILDTVAKNLPDHPLAKMRFREQALGKELTIEYTPVDGDKVANTRDFLGKVVVVNFWATWCAPCKAELPQLKDLLEKYHKDGFVLIGVSLDEKEDALRGFVKENGIRWTQAAGDKARKLAGDWGIDSLPTAFVIDRKGRLRSDRGQGKLDRLIPELLGEK